MTIGGKCTVCVNAMVNGVKLPGKNGIATCLAFPEGIPDEIRQGKNQHNSVIEGQIGDYIFERITKEQ